MSSAAPPPGTPPHSPWEPAGAFSRLAGRWAGLGLFEWDLATDAMQWSTALWRWLGPVAKEGVLTGNDWHRAMLPEDRPRAEAVLRAARDGQADFACRFRVRDPVGGLRHLLAHAEAERDAEGRVRTLRGIVQDITEAERQRRSLGVERSSLVLAREALETAEFVVNSLNDLISLVDLDMVYRMVNDAWCRHTGLAREQVLGRKASEVLPGVVTQQRLDLIHACVRECRPQTLVAPTSLRGGHDAVLESTFVPYLGHQGEMVGVVTVTRDITDRQRADQAQAQAREEAERASRAKSDFLAGVSHELRTPLNAILGFSQLLREGSSLPAESSDTAAAEIQRAGQHLLTLVDDLIDLGQAETGRLDLAMARVAIDAIVNESLSMVAPLAAQRGIRIVFAGGPARNAMVQADARRLRQVLINLLSNAIKYNRTDGSVRVHCGWRLESSDGLVPSLTENPGGAFVRITVQDTGVGISPEMGQRVFSAFDRLGAERGSTQGTGIGLVISQRLARAMGGDIGYESQPAQGSVFWVDLPQARPQPAQRLAQRGGAVGSGNPLRLPRVGGRAPRVLVAEDYAPNQAVLRLQLRSLGCEVDAASDGAQALTLWQTQGCDLLLTDLDMPRMDGLELARTVRALEASRQLAPMPIVAVSAAVVGDERRQCQEAGISALLVKPVSIESLAASLAHWLAAPDGGGLLPAPGLLEVVPPPAPLPAVPLASSAVEPPVLDLIHLYHVLGRTSATQARSLLDTFLQATRAGLRALDDERSGREEWRREMHRQHSSARTVGAMAYATLVQTMEQQLRDETDSAMLGAWRLRLRAALDAVAAESDRSLEESGLPSQPLPLPLRPETGTPLCASVLVVDDDPVVLMQMEQMLRGIGVTEVLLAHNGVEALQAMQRRAAPVEVVVFDLNMPEMDGVEMIRRFSQSGFGGGLILMSGADEQLLATVGRLAVMQGLAVLGHIQKPVTPGTMRVLLRKGSSVPVAPLTSVQGQTITPEALRAGIAAQEFTVWFQPKVHVVSLEPTGVEALARWRRADGSQVPPDVFIAVAEQAGLIGELSQVLLQAALQEGARLHAAGFRLTVAINLSALWLDDLDLPDLLLFAVQRIGLRPADIMLEVTETGLTKDLATALDVLSRLRLKGFGLSIDDFGIGYSNFEQLGRIPFTEMKLDRSFVNRAVRDAAALAILESSMAMAQRLQLSTVAEGVETERELQLMRTLGCDAVQGYLIARPMPLAQLLNWLAPRAPGG